MKRWHNLSIIGVFEQLMLGALMTLLKKFFGLGVATAVGGNAMLNAHAADLSGFSATYKVQADDKIGSATRTLSKSGNHYTYHVQLNAAGIASLSQSANFSVAAGKILPASSSTSVKILGVGNTHQVKFHNDTKTLTNTYKGKSTTLKMNRQAYDDLSLEAQIRQELINGKFSGSYDLVKKGGIETTQFKKSATTKISVPAGTYDVICIDRIHKDTKRATSFWVAPSLNYLPVKVSQTSNGKVISMELTKVN